MLQGPCTSVVLNDNANADFAVDDAPTSINAPFGNTFETRTSPPDRPQEMWGSTVFSLPELGGGLLGDCMGAPEMEGLLGDSSSGCVPVLVPALGDGQEAGAATDVKPSPGHRVASFVSSNSLSVPQSASGCNGAPVVSSAVHTPQTNHLSLSSLFSGGNTASLPPNGSAAVGNGNMNHSSILSSNNNNNNSSSSNIIGGSYAGMPPAGGGTSTMLAAGAYQHNSQVAQGMSGSIPNFFTAPQGAGNVVMFTSSPSTQTLCIPAGGAPAVFSYVVFPSPSQSGMDVSGAVAYSPVTAVPPPMGAVVCSPPPPQGGPTPSPSNPSNPQSMHAMYPMWTPSTVQAMQGVPPANLAAPAPVASGFNKPEANTAVPPPLGATPIATEVTNNVINGHGTNGTVKNGSVNGPVVRGPRGSPPSYDSLRLQLVKRRPPPGRQRSGTNVHGSLQGICAYYSYNLSAALKQYEQPDARPSRPGEQVLPVFIQMFPCELRDRTIVVLNRVVLATCGPDIATVVGIEPRSETSFIALVRTNALWQLIHKLRCRVLMDRHGFWYAEDIDQYLRLKEYCENVRRLPQQMRHFQTDGLPCMPLVVELSRSVNASAVTSSPAPPSFDEVAPIATVERHVRMGTASGSNEGDSPRCESFSLHDSA